MGLDVAGSRQVTYVIMVVTMIRQIYLYMVNHLTELFTEGHVGDTAVLSPCADWINVFRVCWYCRLNVRVFTVRCQFVVFCSTDNSCVWQLRQQFKARLCLRLQAAESRHGIIRVVSVFFVLKIYTRKCWCNTRRWQRCRFYDIFSLLDTVPVLRCDSQTSCHGAVVILY